MMPVSMRLTLLASLCIPHAVLPHSRPIVPCANDLQGERSPSNMASTNAFMEICHDTDTLISTYTGEDGMSVAMTEQLSINQGISFCVSLDRLRFYRFCQKHPISKVTLVWCHLGLHYANLQDVQRFFSQQAINTYLGHLQCFMCQRLVPSSFYRADLQGLHMTDLCWSICSGFGLLQGLLNN